MLQASRTKAGNSAVLHRDIESASGCGQPIENQRCRKGVFPHFIAAHRPGLNNLGPLTVVLDM